MSAGRAVFAKGKQREFLKHAKELSKLNWELFASHIGISSYNVLRATYLNERNTLPVAVLSKAAHLFKDATLCSQIVGFRPAHWGQSKGGSISLKKWHATMRKKPKSYHDLQSRRFLKARSYDYETSYGYEVRSLHELLVSGFRSPRTWIRLLEKLRLYLSYKAADRILVVHLEQDRETALKVARQLGSLVKMILISDMGDLIHTVTSSKDSLGNVRIISIAQALQACRRMSGKRFHWYQLIQKVPKGRMGCYSGPLWPLTGRH